MSQASNAANILFIMTDQQRFDALSCHGGIPQTPNLDRLALKGADLRQHFSQAPVCVPSRCSIFSGQYPHATNVLENFARLPSDRSNLFKTLKEADYHISYFGKNHMLPDEVLETNLNRFDPFGSPSQDPQRQAYQELERQSLKRLDDIGSYASSEYHDFPDDVTTSGLIAKNARKALRDAPKDRPWAIVASFYDPHVPHLAPRRFAEMYPQESLSIETPSQASLEQKAPRVAIKRQAQGSIDAGPSEKKFYSSVYYSMCSYVDELIGGILEELESRSDAHDTIIVFTSDHGDFNWDHGLCKKDLLLYDSLLHVPAIISWPKRIAPQVIDDTFTEHVDLLPTLLELAGLSRDLNIQGRSMASLLEGKATEHRSKTHAEVCYPDMRNPYKTYPDFIYNWRREKDNGFPNGETTPFNVPGDFTKSLRTKEWTYIWYGSGFEELYDRIEDPKEKENLAVTQAEETEELRRELKLELFEWVLQTTHSQTPSKLVEKTGRQSAWVHP